MLVDCATLTGAARVALGPDLPALFCNDDALADALLQFGNVVHDPLWRLPLWAGYDDWLKSPVADLNNVSSKPFAGAIVAGSVPATICCSRVSPGCTSISMPGTIRPGRAGPEGGEAMAMRALFALASKRICWR